jgi:hypothetical protein
MARHVWIIAGALVFVWSGATDAAGAQKKSAAAPAGKKLYRWVDKQGNIHYDDALPPEAVDQARQEISAKTGNTTSTVARALTPEEQAQQAAAAHQAEIAAASAEAQARNEHAMLTSYGTEADLRRAYGDRLELLKSTLESTDVGLQNLHSSLADLLTDAAEAELAHKPINAKRAGEIREMHAEMLRQQTFQANRKAELMSLDAEFQRMLTRYRELQAAAKGGAAAPASAASSPVPPQP